MLDDAAIARWLRTTPDHAGRRPAASGRVLPCSRCGRATDIKHRSLDGRCPECDEVMPCVLPVPPVPAGGDVGPERRGSDGETMAIVFAGIVLLAASLIEVLSRIP